MERFRITKPWLCLVFGLSYLWCNDATSTLWAHNAAKPSGYLAPSQNSAQQETTDGAQQQTTDGAQQQTTDGAQQKTTEESSQAVEADAKTGNQDSEQASDEVVTPTPVPTDSLENVEIILDADPAELITLGSLSESGDYRFLTTFSTAGASIVRVELNARNRDGTLAYRDLEHFGAYLGKLELSRTSRGIRIGVVGPGTPAAAAGLQAGDYLVSVDDVPVTTSADFWDQIAKTKIGQELKIGYSRGDDPAKQQTTVVLTDQPLEMIKHEVNFVEPGAFSPPSFLLQLHKPERADQWIPIDSGMMNGIWDYKKSTTATADVVDFTYVLSEEKLAPLGLSGPITVTKRFSLPKLSPEMAQDLDSKSFHIDFELMIAHGGAGEPQRLGVQIDGPTGATTEGWWYQNKIHGRSTAIGYIAGARDIVCSTAARPYRFEGCPEIVAETARANPEIYYIIDKAKTQNEDPQKRIVNFLGVDTQYFNIALIPTQAETNTEPVYECFSAIARVASSKIPTQKYLHRTVDCTFMLYDVVSLVPGQTYRQSFEIFAGPKQKELLENYGLQDNLTYGWFAMFSKFLCWLLRVFYMLTFSWSYGLAIVLLTVLVRLLMLPISRKAAKNAQMMQLLAPEMKRIADKYKDNMEKRAQAQKELFRSHNYNPAGGCLLMFFQLPIFIGLYRGLSVDIALRDQPLIPGMNWCTNLAAPDQMLYWKEWMPAFLGSESGWLGPYFNVLPLITIVLFLIQQKLFTPPPTDEQQALAQKMMSYMMIFMGVMFFKVPAGLCIYFITSSIWGIMERKLLPKPTLSEDKVNSIKQSLEGKENDLVATPTSRANNALQSSKKSSSQDSSNGTKPAGFMNRIKDAIDSAQNKKPKPLDAEAQKQQDRERKQRLRDKGF